MTDDEKALAKRLHWQGCRLVNPLCPDDLCVLPQGHPGTEQGKHVLGTDLIGQRPYKVHPVMFLAPKTRGPRDLIFLGAKAARAKGARDAEGGQT